MKKLILYLFFIFFSLFGFFAQAAEVNLPLLVKSRYFSVYAKKEVDVNNFLYKLNFNYLKNDANFIAQNSDLKSVLAQTLDSLFLEISNILDIHVYDLNSNLNIYLNTEEVQKVFREIFKKDFDQISFYLPETNSIYISENDLALGVLGHEIAHSIVSHYFVVSPPVKVAEVLCGYVEYSLRKSNKKVSK